MTGHHCAAHLHVVLLLLVCVTVSATFGGAEPARNWRGCVLALPRLFVTPTPQRFEWTNEARDRCGFTAIDLNVTAPAVPLTGGGLERLQWLDQRSMTFIGDSTALRMYVYSHNLLVQPAQRIPYSKVAAAPPSMEKKVVLATGAQITLRFFRMMFISTAGDAHSLGPCERAPAARCQVMGGGVRRRGCVESVGNRRPDTCAEVCCVR